MAARRQPLLEHVHRLAACLDPEADAILLERFARQRDDVAFEALVQRHGAMVLDVCRRVLGNVHDAEDIFQATFLVLSRKAADGHPPDSLPAWLHAIAHRLALKHRQSQKCRHNREARKAQTTETLPPCKPLEQLTAWEMLQALDEELQQLPEVNRLPLILCYLEGRPQEEAAEMLGWTLDSVKGRLKRGRALLHDRLARRGLALGMGLLAAAALGQGVAKALPAGLVRATVEASLRFAAGEQVGIAAGMMALAEGGMRMTGMKIVAVLLGLTLAASVGGVLARQIGAREEIGSRLEEPGASAETTRPQESEGKAALRVDRFSDPLPPHALARMGTVRLFNGDKETAPARLFAYSPDGKLIASHIHGAIVALWDTATGKEICRLNLDHGKENRNLCWFGFAPDGKSLVTTSYQDLCMWALPTGKLIRRVDYPDTKIQNKSVERNGISFLPDGRILAAVGYVKKLEKVVENGKEIQRWTGGVFVWDMATGKVVCELNDPTAKNLFWTSAFSPDGKLAAIRNYRDENGSGISLWDMATDKEIRQLIHNEADTERTGVTGLAFSRDGKMLAAADGKAISVWDVATGKVLHLLTAESGGNDTPLVFSPDGKILVGGRDVHFWDMETGKEIRSLDLNDGQIARFSSDGKALAIGNATGVISLWDVATGKETFTRPGHRQPINTVIYSPDGKTLASLAGKTICLWDVATGKQLRPLLKHKDWGSRSIAYSPDSKTLASADNNTLHLWDTTTGEEIRQFERGGDGGGFYSVTFSPDGKFLAALLGGEPPAVVLWEVATGKRVYTLATKNPARSVWGYGPIVFSPDGRLLATRGEASTVSLWEVATGKYVGQLGGLKLQDRPGFEASVRSLAFSSDGRVIATSSTQDDKVRLWEVVSGKQVGHLDVYKHRDEKLPPPQGGNPGWHGCLLAFSADGRMLATAVPEGNGNGGKDLAVTLWDAATCKEIGRLAGHRCRIQTLAFSPDGKTLTSAGDDLTCLVWDVKPFVQKLTPVAARPLASQTLSKEQLETAWADLENRDAAKAHQAILALREAPEQAISLLKERLQPAAPLTDPEKLTRWIADLDSERFAVRDKAQRAIQGLGELAIPALRRALANQPSLEMKRRLQNILVAIEPKALPDAPPEQLRQMRAVQVLESIATPEARQVLQSLAKGVAEVSLTREAQAALERLAKRSASRP